MVVSFFMQFTWLRLNFTASYSLILSSFFTVSLFGTLITSEPQKKRSENKDSRADNLISVFACYEFLHTFRPLTVSHINGVSFAISKFSHYFVHRLLNCVHPQLYASYTRPAARGGGHVPPPPPSFW